jgi:hypothetical protein
MTLAAWLLLETLVGRGVLGASLFFLGTIVVLTTSIGKITSQALHVPPPALAQPSVWALLGIVIISARRRFSAVDCPARVAALCQEAVARFALFPRFALSSPALASFVQCSNEVWRKAVTQALQVASIAVIDLTGYGPDSPGLRWELGEALRLARGIVLVVEEGQWGEQETFIRAALKTDGARADVRIIPYSTGSGEVSTTLLAAIRGMLRARPSD